MRKVTGEGDGKGRTSRKEFLDRKIFSLIVGYV